jgi:hypothetical protein
MPAVVRRTVPALLATLLLAGCGLGRRYWTPTREQMARAEAIARTHVLGTMSDQAGTPAAAMTTNAQTGELELPVVFTIGGTPHSRFGCKYWGSIVRGTKVVNVQFFDRTKIPDWDTNPKAAGEFPASFVVSVDVEAGRALPAAGTGTP